MDKQTAVEIIGFLEKRGISHFCLVIGTVDDDDGMNISQMGKGWGPTELVAYLEVAKHRMLMRHSRGTLETPTLQRELELDEELRIKNLTDPAPEKH